MISDKVKTVIVQLLLISILLCCWNENLQFAATPSGVIPPSVLGTWTGESICVGNHPACKDEVVVYRIEAIPNKSAVVMLLADKIIDSQRVPMYKLEFQYDEAKGALSGEFTKRQTHGVWQYHISGDTMEGTLVLLPDRTLGRRINVKRVGPEQVPAAPAKEMYEGT